MNDEVEPYRGKALECLASAEADLEAGRYNGAAVRAYYAAYNAAIVALIRAGYPSEDWGHDEVPALVAGQLIRRRKLLDDSNRRAIPDLMAFRLKADYGRAVIRRREAERALSLSHQFVRSILEVEP